MHRNVKAGRQKRKREVRNILPADQSKTYVSIYKLSCGLILILFTILPKTAFCQGIFQLDEQKILTNENLDYYLNALKSERFTMLKRKKDIPKFIKEQLPWINDKSIADKNEAYQATDVIMDESLPWRQFIFLCTNNHLFVATYVRGGVGEINYILFVKFRDHQVLDVWVGYGPCKKLNSIADILSCINKNQSKKNGLHSNFVDK